MRSRLLLIPVAAICAAAPAASHAYEYSTIEDAKARLFPGATLTSAHLTLTDGQAAALARDSGSPVWRRTVRAWSVSGGGWFVVDQVLGRDDRITYAVALDAGGAMTGIEILVCEPDYDVIRRPAWLTQFIGKRRGDPAHVRVISGATLSTTHVTEGVRRVLYTYPLLAASKAG